MNITLNRRNYFDQLGTTMPENTSIENAIQMAGLDYEVNKVPLFLENGDLVEGAFATQKSDDGKVLGVVGNQYTVVQNTAAYDFVDTVIGMGAQIESAGHFKDFSKSFVLAKTPEREILGDKYAPYLLFTNSFDGSGSVRAALTPVRVVCSNAIICALSQAVDKISIRHSTNAFERLQIAQSIMMSNQNYMDALNVEAEQLAMIPVTKSQYTNQIVPFVLKEMNLDNMENRQRNKDRADKIKEDLITVYDADDLSNFNNSAWKVAQAIGDFESHYEPARNKDNQQIYMQRIIGGMVLLNAVVKMMTQRYSIR